MNLLNSWSRRQIATGLLFVVGIVSFCSPSSAARAQIDVPPSTDREIEILIRDLSGFPLDGVMVEFVRADGSFLQSYQTDLNGQISTFVRPGSYLVQFIGSWNGRMFLPVEEQNAGAVPQNYEVTGGLGVYIEPGADLMQLRFVVAESEDDQLVPLYDLAVSDEIIPDPYLYDDAALPAIGILPTFQRPEIILEPVVAEATFDAMAAAANDNASAPEQRSLNRQATIFSLELDIDWFEFIITVIIMLILLFMITTIAVILMARQLRVPSKEAERKI